MSDFWIDVLFVVLVAGLPAAAIIVDAWLVARWRGRFRLAAALPAAVWLLWMGSLMLSWQFDPTGRVLFAFEGSAIAALALAYLGLMALIRRAEIAAVRQHPQPNEWANLAAVLRRHPRQWRAATMHFPGTRRS